jgi:hypothetical protein
MEKLAKDSEMRKLLPSTKPAFKISYYRFLLDDDENFWALTFERENEGITYDIFNKEGIYIKKAFLGFDNSKFKPLIIKNGILYAIHLDEDYINRVKGYKLYY